jgi:hypothetical protein
VEDCVAKVYEHVPLPEINNTTISANAHASFDSMEAMQQFLSKYASPKRQIVSGGTIAYILVPQWPEEIRVMIDRSLVYPAGLFLMWTTSYRGNKISRDLLKNVTEIFKQSAVKLELPFPKLIK